MHGILRLIDPTVWPFPVQVLAAIVTVWAVWKTITLPMWGPVW